MGALQTRSLDWTSSAPLRVEARGTSSASPEAVFAVLADHERWPEWFPGVKRVTVLGPAEGVGARRRVAIPGATVDEEFIAWEPGRRWAFTATAARPGLFRSLVEDCRLEPTDGGGTAITYTMSFDPAPVAGVLLRAMAGRMRANNTKALANLARRAESAAA